MEMKMYHVLGSHPYYTNCFILITNKNNAVAIDASGNIKEYEQIFKETGAKLTHILLTHGHDDHVETLKELKQLGAKVYITKEDSAFFKIDADEFLEDEQNVVIDDLKFKVITTPGHTPGSIMLRIEDLLFSGDTIFDGDIGRTDLPGGSSEQIMLSIKKVLQVVTDNPKVLPGHETFSDMNTQRKYNHYLKNL